MKKPVLITALAAAALSLWGFYPKAADQPKVMQVVGEPYYISSHAYVVVTSPEGEVSATEIDVQSKAKEGRVIDQARSMQRTLRAATLTAVNKYRQEGWRIVSTHSEYINGTTGNIVFTLER